MFLKNNKYGSLSKRGKGKLDVELKDQLKNITKEILDSIDVNELTRTQKIQFLKSSLSYLLPKEIIADNYVSEDLPLFIDDPHGVKVEIGKMKNILKLNQFLYLSAQ